VHGYSVTVGAQEFVAPRRTVTTNDVNFGVGPFQCDVQVVKQIEYSRIVLVNVAGAVIPQILIELREGPGNVVATSPVDSIYPFPRVDVKEPQTIFWFR
jgi:hypothetical protein